MIFRMKIMITGISTSFRKQEKYTRSLVHIFRMSVCATEKTGYHHGQRGVHISYIVHGVEHHFRKTNPGEKEQNRDYGRYNHRRHQPFSYVFPGKLFFHKDDAVSPGEQVEHNNVGGQKENPVAAQHAVDQWNADESAVGIHGIIAFDVRVRTAFRTDQQRCYKDSHNVAEYGGSERNKKTPHKFRLIIRLICGNDNERVDYKKKEIGYGFIPFLIHQFDFITQNSEQHNEEHLHKLLKDQNKHN